MDEDAAPVVDRRRLAVELRRLRVAAGKTIQEVAEALECSAGKISRVETGAVGARIQDVRELLDLYGVSGGSRDELLDLVRQSRQRPWWYAYADVMPRDSARFFGLQHSATTIYEYGVVLVPGLLQTDGYARALISSSRHVKPEVAERRIELRLLRPPLLTRSDPPAFHVVLDEAILHRMVGGPKVMAGQLSHLLEVATLPNVTIQIMPFDHGEYAAMGAPFVVFEFTDPADPKIVYLEQPTRNIYLERPDEVDFYRALFDEAREQALSSEASGRLIAEKAGSLS